MASKYKKGQSVIYKPIGGPDSNSPQTTGTISDVLTEPGLQADRSVQSTPSNPRYEASIVNDNTGYSTIIYESNILGKT
ncbi:hypothetical protein F4779DRAFT_622455 [Xylariaceae sp. FL0662B]|nr:hypothetical protein F4779DRAFT_622455 [Xylariaceae sp. FL0662B]